MTERPIYLDNNATTPLDPRVLEAMMPWLTEAFGNAASQTHAYGIEARAAVERARGEVARALGARADEIVFTSGATESTNLALRGLFEARDGRLEIVTAPTEHKATLDTAKRLVARGARLRMLAVDGEGRIDLGELAEAIAGPDTVVSLMHANNEIGVLHPVEAIGALCRERGALFHCDAAQSFGKLPIDAAKVGIDLLSLSAHKLYGPKGVGALYVGSRVNGLEEQIHGGGHEGGRRSGTLNVPGLVGLGAATRLAVADQSEERERLLGLRDRLLERLRAELDDFRVNGPLDDRIEGNLNLSFGGVDPALLLLAIPDLALSSGSACNSDTVEPSYVLTAIGREGAEAAAAVRFGIGRFTTPEEIERAADAVVAGVRGLREMAG